ncbi:hypothetical protein [Salipiger abyssi]|uniref:Uncharacterized protein n=1 Tax=Salipiger abyssi TaxID=1250539 RepID=A0A1P8UXJ0_9RHOB|nr:hypothetical protein [Salipiger abyssi]ALF02094.1 hypothetical protein vBPeaSP1_003 [Pelagibaca phage vB_PeaS-P1]APZ54109.1 hypothetical protein Ga0080574_TMP3775 [Salipiger abyssi]
MSNGMRSVDKAQLASVSDLLGHYDGSLGRVALATLATALVNTGLITSSSRMRSERYEGAPPPNPITLPVAPANDDAVIVLAGGSYQPRTEWTRDGAELTMVDGWPDGITHVDVLIWEGVISTASAGSTTFEAGDSLEDRYPMPAFAGRDQLVSWWGVAGNRNAVPPGKVFSDGERNYLKMPVGHALYGTIADLPGACPSGAWDFGHFGADYTGTVDSTAIIQAAITAAAGTKLHSTGAALRMDGTAVISAHGQEIAFGATRIDATAFTGWLAVAGDGWNTGRVRAPVEVRGQEGPSTTLSADTGRRATTITVASASGISAGDQAFIQSDGERWYTLSGKEIYKGEPVRITDVTGNTLTLDRPLRFEYDATSHTVTVDTYTPVRDVRISGGIWQGGGVRQAMANGFGPAALFSEGYYNCTFEPVYVEGFQGRAIHFKDGQRASAINTTLRGHTDAYGPVTEDLDSGFYGVWFDRSAICRADGITGIRLRHVVDGNDSFDVICDNIMPLNNHAAAYTCHEGCGDWTFRDGCLADQIFHYAMQWRGGDVTLQGVPWQSDVAAATEFGFTVIDGAVGDMTRVVTLDGAQISANYAAVFVNIPEVELRLLPGTVLRSTRVDSSPLTVGSANMSSLIARGVTFVTKGDSCVEITAEALSDGNVVDIQDCILDGYTGAGVRNYSDVTKAHMVVKNNHVRPANPAAEILTYDNLNSVDSGSGRGYVISGPNYGADGEVWGIATNANRWTPALITDGVTNFSYGFATRGQWERVSSNCIKFSGRVSLTGLNTSTGKIKIDLSDIGLPFATYVDGSASLEIYDYAAAGTRFGLQIEDDASGRITLLRYPAAATTPVSAEVSDLTATTTIKFSGHVFLGA